MVTLLSALLCCLIDTDYGEERLKNNTEYSEKFYLLLFGWFYKSLCDALSNDFWVILIKNSYSFQLNSKKMWQGLSVLSAFISSTVTS